MHVKEKTLLVYVFPPKACLSVPHRSEQFRDTDSASKDIMILCLQALHLFVFSVCYINFLFLVISISIYCYDSEVFRLVYL